MAADECLLDLAAAEGLRAVRIYQWKEATVSLGYFQEFSEFQSAGRFDGLPVVRRLSGGGAILHDHELTYSLVLPSDDPLTAQPTRLYARVHDAILSVLRDCGVSASMRGEDLSSVREPFLCFARGDRHDIVLDGHKVVGSAQRRRRGAVLQHGSLLLAASPYASELPGINDLARRKCVSRDSAVFLGEAIARSCGAIERSGDWPAMYEARIRQLEEQQKRRLVQRR